MKSNLFILLGFILLSLVACTATSDQESRGSLFCNINRNETYQVGTDPRVDFNATNLNKNISFNNVTCPDVENVAYTQLVSQVRRTGNLIEVIENPVTLAGFRLDLFVSGNSVLPVENSFNINNCTVKRVWTGSLDPATNSIDLTQNINYIGNCAPVFLDQDDDDD